MSHVRWIFAGQLGEQFDDGGPMLLIEARSALKRRPMQRAKAHLILSAIRHRARGLGDRVEFHQVDTYAEVVAGGTDLEVIDPTSFAGRRAVRRYGARVLPSRGFVIIGNGALRRGYGPRQLTDCFTDMFVDDACISKMTDHCGGCRFNPKVRLGGDDGPTPPATGRSSTAPNPCCGAITAWRSRSRACAASSTGRPWWTRKGIARASTKLSA
ncbi:MAG: hypothetical protein JWM51_831 [Microbacteriaceae bacterium]|nr:hypothetical protein [Microbacteriaceae bacterium]